MKRGSIALLLFYSGIAFAGGVPIISPSTATTLSGGTIQFTSTDTVTWSLAVGSTGTISVGGLYTAPTFSWQARNVISGCMVQPNDAIWNVAIDSLPLDANSATRIANVAGSPGMQIETAMPGNPMDNTTVTSSMTFYYTTHESGKYYPIVAKPYTGVENALYPSDYFAQDRHQLGVNTSSCTFYEIYNKYEYGTNTGSPCLQCNAQSGTQYNGTSYQLPYLDGATDAAGMPIQPILLRYDELKSGHINHALRYTMANGYNYAGFIWPGTNYSPQCGSFSTCFPYGSRIRLKGSFSEVGYTTHTLTIIHTLKKYGAFMTDGGTTLGFQASWDIGTDTGTWTAINSEIRFGTHPNMADFEQVDESSLMVSTATSRVLVPNTYNVIPSTYAIVIASNTTAHTYSVVYVALQPVTVGTKNPSFPAISGSINFMAGTPAYQLPVIVNPQSAAQTATCSMSPTLGSITSGCVYTAPTGGIASSSTTIITMSATADSTATINFPLTVFSSDAIRINVGGKAGSISSPVIPYDAAGNYGPDASGNMWASDPTGGIFQWYSLDDNSSPQSSWSGTDQGLYYTARHGASDGAFAAVVPNGNYTLTLGFASSDGNVLALSSATIDSQGTVILSTATAVVTGNIAYAKTDHSYTIQVTNNQFYMAIRQIYSDRFPFINKLSLTFVSGLTTTRPITGNGRISGGGSSQ